MLKCFSLLLTLVPFCLSAANPEVKEAVESVTYSTPSKTSGWVMNITIEKTKKSDSVTYSQILNSRDLKILGGTVAYVKDGKCVRYTKNRRTKEISVSTVEDNITSFTTEFFGDCTEEEKKERLKLLKALFITKKHKASLQKLKD